MNEFSYEFNLKECEIVVCFEQNEDIQIIAHELFTRICPKIHTHFFSSQGFHSILNDGLTRADKKV